MSDSFRVNARVRPESPYVRLDLRGALDHEAQDLVLEGVIEGIHEGLPPAERCFFLMPLMHAENVALQRLSVRLFGADPDNRDSHLGYAEQHAAIVERFGRFPHRNATLGRESSEDEQRYLDDGGETF